MYQFFDKIHTLYELLQDELSKEIFQARFAVDIDPSISNVRRLVSLGDYKALTPLGWTQLQKDLLRKLNQEQKKIVLYGAAGTGQFIAEMLESEHIDFYGFCGRDAERFPGGFLGKPVITPDELIAHGDEYYVMPAVTSVSYPEIYQLLREHNYPEDHMLGWVDSDFIEEDKQYFEFPELYRPGTAFIQAGCLNGETCYKFADWCGGGYSFIITFEPDPGNYTLCCKKFQDIPLPNVQLINAGLSSKEGTAVFDAHSTDRSHIISAALPSEFNFTQYTPENEVTIRTATIDDIAGDRAVGFIELDVQGAELDALQGAKNTILRDKPLLAICVYHLRGDMLAIMNYLHQLLPEYRFLLRHYAPTASETILYASIDL